MGALRHRKGEECTCPLWKCFKVSLCISRPVITAERSDELCRPMLFTACRLLMGAYPKPPPGFHPWGMLSDFLSQTLNFSTTGKKNPKGAHGLKETTNEYYTPTLPLCAQSFQIDFQVDFPFNRRAVPARPTCEKYLPSECCYQARNLN